MNNQEYTKYFILENGNPDHVIGFVLFKAEEAVMPDFFLAPTLVNGRIDTFTIQEIKAPEEKKKGLFSFLNSSKIDEVKEV